MFGTSVTRAAMAACVVASAMASASKANVITFVTPPASQAGGQPVNASVQFTTSTNQIVVLLSNLQANPTSVAQNLSDLLFTVSTGQHTGSILSSLGRERNVAADHTYSDGATVSTGWALSTSGSQLYLNVLGTAIGPAHTIIGPPNGSGVYSAANGSIAGNDPHNPFLGLSATFTLSVPGVTDDSSISAATFSFGTTPGSNVPGITQSPAPGSLCLLGIGGVLLARRRR